VTVAGTLDPPASLARRWRSAGVRAVLLQYVPFLYGRRGISTYPEELVDAAEREGIPTVLFIHEPWVPFTRPQWLVSGLIQRRQLTRLVRRVAAAVTPVPEWQHLIEPAPDLQYVGSTLGEPRSEPAGPMLHEPVVFSPFGAGLNWRWIARAVESIGAPRVLVVLGGTEAEASAHPEVRRWMQAGWDWRGRLPAADALAALQRAPLVLAPFVDGLTARRTSAAAALSAGARLVSSIGPLFDPIFRTAPIDLAQDDHEFAELAKHRWDQPDSPADRQRRIQWYDQNLNARMLDDRLLELLLRNAA
jgi:hypothetical protein